MTDAGADCRRSGATDELSPEATGVCSGKSMTVPYGLALALTILKLEFRFEHPEGGASC
jgi:hypothetical protein